MLQTSYVYWRGSMADAYNVWASVVTDGTKVTSRLKCEGGWIVRVIDDTENYCGICFVPDPGWKWNPTATNDA